jgi:hypothetical protein
MATIVIFCEIVQRILVHIRGYIKEKWALHLVVVDWVSIGNQSDSGNELWLLQ